MTVRIFIAGDIVNTRHDDGIFCERDVKAVIASVDFGIANLEAPVRSNGRKARKTGPVLDQQPGTLRGLVYQGFHAVALANNHIMDYGPEGLAATIDEINTAGLARVGAGFNRQEAYEPLLAERNGVRIAFINGCEAHHGVHDLSRRRAEAGYAWLFGEEFRNTIAQSARHNDVTIVLSHAGLEHFHVPQKEWRVLYRQFCDLGATAVVGAHPHVPQGCERYRDSLIFYSLGNFYFDTNRYAESADITRAVILTVGKTNVPTWEPVWTQKNARSAVELLRGPPPDFDQLDEMLGEHYDDHWRAMTLTKYQELLPLLERSIGGWYCQSSTRAMLRHLASRFLRGRRETDKELLLQHLLRNESYYFTLRHALAIATDGRSAASS
jgi:hypothetical protein